MKVSAKGRPSLKLWLFPEAGSQDIPPRWPPPLFEVLEDEATYEVALVTMSSIALVTSRTVKVRTSLQF